MNPGITDHIILKVTNSPDLSKRGLVNLLALFPMIIGLLLVSSSWSIAQNNSIDDQQINFGDGLNGQVLATVIHNNTLYAGGNFTFADGTVVNHIARWDKDRWRPLLSGLSGPVYALFSYQGKLYVGGDFKTASGKTANNIAMWDGSKWETIGLGFNNAVRSIGLHNNQIVVGGDFTNSGTNPVQYLAVLNGTSWVQLGVGGPDGPISSLLSFEGKLYIGGSFSKVGSFQAKNIASYNGVSWTNLGEGIDRPARGLAAFQGKILVATDSSNQVKSAVREWTGNSWMSFGEFIGGTIRAITSQDNQLVVAGRFITVTSNDTISNLSRYTPQGWSPLGNPDSTVHATVLSDNVVYFGGAFNQHEGIARSFFSRHALVAPQRPAIISPLNNATRVTIRPTLTWASKAAFSYRVQLSDEDTFTSLEIDTLLTETNQLQVELKKGLTRYYARVLASNNINSSEWSITSTFTTQLRFPDQIEPLNGQQAVSSSGNLRWLELEEALSYQVQIATTDNPQPAPASLIFNQAGIPAEVTSFNYSGLLDDAIYYWRIKADYKDGDLIRETDWSPFSSFRVNLIPPVPVALAPLESSQQDTAKVVFRWGRVPTADTYQFQLSLTTDFENKVRDESTALDSLTISGLLTSQKYYWRVRSVNVAGYSPWSTVRSLQTKSAIPSKVILVSPGDRDRDVKLTPTLLWNKARAASKYRIEISNSGTFPPETTQIYETLGDTAFQVPKLQQGLVYNWRVRGINDDGLFGEQSSSRSFTTINAATPAVSPTLLSPLNNSDSLGTSLQFSWQSVAGAISYRIQLSTDLGFNTIVYDNNTLTTNQVQIDNLTSSQEYYWRVLASNNAGEGPWSPKWFFSTLFFTPSIPIQTSPTNFSGNIAIPPVIRWDSVQGAESYEIQYSTQNNFETDFSQFPVSGNSYALGSATPLKTYYWRVRALNRAGTSDWSPVWVFTTIRSLPDQPSLISPLNEARNLPQTVVLQWNGLSEANQYRVQVSETTTFTSGVITDVYVESTSFTQVRLKGGINYYWRVAAINEAGQGIWSVVSSFLTIPSRPEPPILVSPLNSDQFIVRPSRLEWRASGVVDSYNIQLDKSPDLDERDAFIIDLKNHPSSKIDFIEDNITPPESNSTYYWRVQANNISGSSEWSPIWSFRTNPGKPGKVLLIDPADETLIGDIENLNFKWAPADSALFYEFEISGSQNFIGDFLPVIRITEQSYKIPTQTPPSPNRTYFWRVRAGNAYHAGDQFGDWSNIRSFTTKPNPPDSVKLLSPVNGLTNAKRKQVLRWQKQELVTRYFIDVSTNPEFNSPLVKDSVASSIDMYEVFLPNHDQTYYWRVRADNLGGRGKPSKTYQLRTFPYPVSITNSFTVTFPNTNQSSYRLVSIPGKIDVPINITFEGSGKQGVDWNAFSIENDILVEAKTGGSGFNFRPGNGFWILSRRPWTITRQPDETVLLNTDDSYRINLNLGWNIISIPYKETVLWQDVKLANKLKENKTVHYYGGSQGWIPPDNLEPNKAYYFYRDADMASYLDIPYPVQEIVQSKEAEILAENKSVSIPTFQMKLYQGDQVVGSNMLILSDKQVKHDYSSREPAPPSHFPTNKVVWLDTVEGTINREWYLITEYLTKETIVRNFSINVSKSDTYRLTLILPEPEGLFAQIWDTKNQRWLKMDDSGTELYLVQGEHLFDLYLGLDQQLSKLTEEMLPTQYELLNNYPNPFNPTTTLRFALPEPNQVQLTIYDVMGRKVRTLISARMEAGYHSIDWNAAHLASGVYIVELIAGAQRRTQKIALIK